MCQNLHCWEPSRLRDYSGIHHGGTNGLIRVELGYPHTN